MPLSPEEKHANRVARRLQTLKRYGLTKAKNAVASDLQKLVRLQEADAMGMCRCCTCGLRLPWSGSNALGERGMQGGHFLTRNAASTLLERMNIHAQCEACNHPLCTVIDVKSAYQEFMVRNYGHDEVQVIRLKHNKPYKFTLEELAMRSVGYRDMQAVELLRIKKGLPSKYQFVYPPYEVGVPA